MKLICLALFFAPLFVLAQSDKKDKTNPEHLQVKEFDLTADSLEPSSVKLPFSSIKIIDSRYDTSIIGFANIGFPGGKSDSYKKLHLKGECANAIRDFFKDRFQNSFDSSGITLLIVIKKLWLSQIEYGKKKDLDLSYNIMNNTKSLYCKWEYYLGKDDSYLPVKRVDTVLTLSNNVDERVRAKFDSKQKEFLRSSLQLLVEMLDFSKGVQAFAQQPKKSMQDITDFNEARFKIPILNNTDITQGVFINFDEFRNNKPSILLYREKKQSIGRYNQKFIEDQNGSQINPYWAYFDGKNIIHGKFGSSVLFRTGNAFTFFYKMVWYSTDNSPGSVIHNFRNEDWIPYEIDMDTGEVY